jgi:hypothetical protein
MGLGATFATFSNSVVYPVVGGALSALFVPLYAYPTPRRDDIARS